MRTRDILVKSWNRAEETGLETGEVGVQDLPNPERSSGEYETGVDCKVRLLDDPQPRDPSIHSSLCFMVLFSSIYCMCGYG